MAGDLGDIKDEHLGTCMGCLGPVLRENSQFLKRLRPLTSDLLELSGLCSHTMVGFTFWVRRLCGHGGERLTSSA
jgi:hypothetical protein